MCIGDIPEIENLSTSEKILFIEDLWDSISVDESSVSLPQSHKDELDRRLGYYRTHPGKLLCLSELQGRIEQRK